MDGLFKVHEDVLKMAKTKEQRDRIKWFHARRVFFENGQHVEGLELARHCEHDDARFLVSLFPEGVPTEEDEVAAVFLARPDDARCLCWAAHCAGDRFEDLVSLSAAGGYGWAQAQCGSLLSDHPRDAVVWHERGAEQGEPEAMLMFADALMDEFVFGGSGSRKRRAEALWRAAAELGDHSAQLVCARQCCAKGSLEQLQWLRRSALQGSHEALISLVGSGRELLQRDRMGANRLLFEVGAALAGTSYLDIRGWSSEAHLARNEIAMLYEQCLAQTKRAVLCWLWAVKEMRVVKDIRLMIADLIWDQRAEWMGLNGAR